MTSNNRAVAAIVFGTIVAGCVAGEIPVETPEIEVSQSDFIRVSERSQFIDIVDGKKFRNGSNWWALTSDGRMVGNIKAGKIDGTWDWNNGAWCREFTAGTKVKERECQHIFVKGREVKFVKDRGAGEESVQRLSRR